MTADKGAFVGTVVSVWRYPVKSMQGEQVHDTSLNERGVLGDRAYALLDRSTGHIASAKHPGKWDRLFRCHAAFLEPPQLDVPLPPVAITLPDGTVISSTDPAIDQVISRVLGRDVTLVTHAPSTPTREADRTPVDDDTGRASIKEEAMALAAPAGTFFDYAPVHILTTATLTRLHELYPQGQFDVRRFRPNIVIAPSSDVRDFIENTWLGRSLRIGTIRIRLIDPSPRCVVTTLAHKDLPRDPGILRTAAAHNAAASVTLAPGVVFSAVVGVYAQVLQAGTIQQGDVVCLE